MDRSFLAAEHENSGLAAAIIALGKSLNLNVVAEGIELPEQITSLRDLGCELGQGFLFAKPMNDEALFQYLVGGADSAAELGEQRSNAA
jgi:EAL domain-containing protein (putative c-di-GMP-specific phosphodiesterase class I)